MTTRLLPLVALLGVLLIQSGCSESPEDIANGNDPLRALTVSTKSTRYDGPYWMRQRNMSPNLYQDALSYCSGHQPGEKPNCAPVVATDQFFESKSRIGKKKGRSYTGILSKDAGRGPTDSLSSNH